MSKYAEVNAKAKRAERTVSVCYRGDLLAEYDRLDLKWREAKEREQSETRRLNQKPESDAIAAEIDALREQMADAMLDLTFRALPPYRWRELIEAHPPREGNRVDERQGVNEDTFIPAAIRACLVPAPTDDEWEGMVGDEGWMIPETIDRLGDVVKVVNLMKVDVPKSRSVSATTPESSSA